MATVGLLHPGEMGAAVGGCLVSVGHEVLWDPAGRSRATTGRALAAELTGVAFGRLVAKSSVILSICPPHAALDVARQVADAGYAGLLRRRQRDLGRDRRAGRRHRHRGGRHLRRRRDHRPAAGGRRAHPPLPVRPAGRRGPRPLQPLPARRTHRRRPAVRGVDGQDGLRRLDQGQLSPAARGPRPRQGGRRRADAAGRVVRCPRRPSASSPSAPLRPRPPRAGAGSPRWRRSPPPWRPPACRRASTRRPPTSTTAPPARETPPPAARRRPSRRPPSTRIMSALM